MEQSMRCIRTRRRCIESGRSGFSCRKQACLLLQRNFDVAGVMLQPSLELLLQLCRSSIHSGTKLTLRLIGSSINAVDQRLQ